MLQKPAQLLAEGPVQLLERGLDEYAELLRDLEGLGRPHLEAIDYAIRQTVLRLFEREPDDAELRAAYADLRAMIPVRREKELAEWAPRWRAFADLIDSRRALSRARREDANVAFRFAHAEEILALVAQEPGLTQVEIGERLELKPANLSRILGILEAHELIERRNLGREKRVHPGRLAPRMAKAGSAARPDELFPPLPAAPMTLGEPPAPAYGAGQAASTEPTSPEPATPEAPADSP